MSSENLPNYAQTLAELTEAQKLIDHWVDRICMYEDLDYLTKGKVLHELTYLRQKIVSARKGCTGS